MCISGTYALREILLLELFGCSDDDAVVIDSGDEAFADDNADTKRFRVPCFDI